MLTIERFLKWLEANNLSLTPPPGFHPTTCPCNPCLTHRLEGLYLLPYDPTTGEAIRELEEQLEKEDTAQHLAIQVAATYTL